MPKSKKDPTNHVLIGQVISDKDSSVIYRIGVDKKISEEHNHAHFTCTCPAFKFSGKGGVERHCKHTEVFTNDMDTYFSLNLTSSSENCEKVLQKILGWELNFSIRPHFAFVKRINPTTFMQVVLTLTEIVCPYIMCSHVMHGLFEANEIQTCKKCHRGFML